MNDTKEKTSKYFWSGSRFPEIIWKPYFKSLTINFFPNTKFRVWCYWSKYKKEKTYFTLILFGNFFWVSTTYVGKKIGKRLYLNAFLWKDYHVYDTSEDICTGSNNNT